MIIDWLPFVRKMRFGKACCSSLCLFVFLCLVSSSACQQKQTQEQNRKIKIVLPEGFYATGLVYHRFGDSRYPSTNTPLDKLEEQLKYITENGFDTYTVSGLLENAHDSTKKVFITIDDGLKSFYTHGWPLFKKYACKVTLFVNTESVGWSDYLNWHQIRELAKSGVEIGSHSHKHSYFLNRKGADRLHLFVDDLLLSEKIFEDSLGFVPRIYAYPYGEFDEGMAQVLKQRGYRLALAQNSGVWSYKSHRFAIPRFPIAGNYVKMKQFVQKVNMRPLLLNADNAFPIELAGNEKLEMHLSLDSLSQLAGFNCFFDNKLNPDVFTINNKDIKVFLYMTNNKRRILLTFTANDKSGRWYWWSKLLVNASANELKYFLNYCSQLIGIDIIEGVRL
ncbi:poly-beta-1,6-N-acetyl-D-glucosamine N-deacetylase precursor [Saccharicrinis fermentans DSM 9555 = JCM 21142]|uniref:Poly-beta-1,6-N-acetyl-D-glucosamine N-deacetylase n=3 Tax=Saccharicrinis fermentans TaxID=982 RepID=W7XYW5_9BACT|nr:poly-beta-1,6-N-acetyl-D-glucosamine N-deacetylase precursor [Saccharicrinis fermentans DSM 9555 = JCM 21142]